MKPIVKNFNDFVNESWDGSDEFTGYTSNCCGAPIMMGNICSNCEEQCAPDEEGETVPNNQIEQPEDGPNFSEFEPNNYQDIDADEDLAVV